MLDKRTRAKILVAQRNEITESIIYTKLSESIKDAHNKKVLKRIAEDEYAHYDFWKIYTKKDVKPNMVKVWFYYLISIILGITFGIKLMEKGEADAQVAYEKITKKIPEAKKVLQEEDKHEKELISMINEERLNYVGSIVLGLNDALVELTGALAGLTFALQNSKMIAMVGLITGIAASFSMAASEYLSTKSEGIVNPIKASMYTGVAYIFTVIFLIFPFLTFDNYFFSLGFTIINAVIVILIFTFYTSVAKDLPFKHRFLEMTVISLGIAAVSFGIGIIVRMFIGA